VGDLSVVIVSPVGALTPLTAAGNGGDGDDFGSGGTGCGATFTTFDDEAASPIRGAPATQAPFAAPFRPHLPLAAHDGSFGSGDWRFYVDDTAAGGAGVVEALSLRLGYEYIVRKKKKAKKKKGK
jgi:hypothetical protein